MWGPDLSVALYLHVLRCESIGCEDWCQCMGVHACVSGTCYLGLRNVTVSVLEMCLQPRKPECSLFPFPERESGSACRSAAAGMWGGFWQRYGGHRHYRTEIMEEAVARQFLYSSCSASLASWALASPKALWHAPYSHHLPRAPG